MKAGAFAAIAPNRAQTLAAADLLLRQASRAAEEAAAAADSSPGGTPPTGKPATTPLAGPERPGGEGIYDIEAVTAAEADGQVSPDEALPKAEHEAGAELSREGGGVGERAVAPAEEPAESGDAEEITAAVEIVDVAVVAESAAGDGTSGEGAGEDVAAEGGAAADVAAEIEAAEAAIEAEAITEPDVEALARRNHLLGPITAKLGRTLKRALQDDQNDLLNALRQASGKPVLDELIPPEVQRERLVSAAEEQLARAFQAGAAFLVAGDAVEGPSVSAVAPTEMAAFEAGTLLAAELAEDLTSLLRHRIEQALSELDGGLEGLADAAGAAYREWKGSRVEGLAGDFATRAFAVGELAVLSSLGEGGAPFVRWVVEDDDAGGSCPDCDDNSLAGPQLAGAEFPTGHVRPPVHPGCRCLLVPVRS